MGKLKKTYRNLKYSLRTKLFVNAFIIFMIFVLGFEAFVFVTLKNYQYNNLKNYMHSQAKFAAQTYLNQSSEYSLNDNIRKEYVDFISNIGGQVQIIDTEGVVIYDSIASSQIGQKLDKEDVRIALSSKAATLENEMQGGEEKSMSVSVPLMDRTSQVGVLRITASLRDTDQDILRQFTIFIIFGVISLLVGVLLSYYLSRTIFKPINKLTEVAKKYSDGQYEVKSNIPYEGEIGELAKTMDEMSDNIIEKEALKTDFISSVSHELRTPLTSIKGWSITLQDEGIDPELVDEGLKIIEKESDRLSDMVEDLLDFSRFTSPNFKLSKSTFNIVTIAQSIVKQLKPRVDDKEITLILNYNHDEIAVVADENRMKQVFINLLDNAIKFTPKGGTVVLDMEDDGEDLICEVIDTGIGISKDDIDKVTLKFYKGTSSESHTGLGLSICEEIITAHNGNLEISSIENEGTTIRFIIPKKVIE